MLGIVLNYWTPTIINRAGVTDVLNVSLLSSIPFVIGALGMLAIARHSDLKLERRWHFLGAVSIGALGLVMLPMATDQPLLAQYNLLDYPSHLFLRRRRGWWHCTHQQCGSGRFTGHAHAPRMATDTHEQHCAGALCYCSNRSRGRTADSVLSSQIGIARTRCAPSVTGKKSLYRIVLTSVSRRA